MFNPSEKDKEKRRRRRRRRRRRKTHKSLYTHHVQVNLVYMPNLGSGI